MSDSAARADAVAAASGADIHVGADTTVDVIVVGAGGSGAPLAARLSDDPGCRVLVLEAGPVPRTANEFPPELLDAAGLRGADPAHPDTWEHPALLTPSRPYALARGRILGGSTTINGAYFMRARRADHDDWVAAGLAEWSFEECLPFWRALETDERYGDTALHGGSGPMPVTRTVGADGGRAPEGAPIDSIIEAATVPASPGPPAAPGSPTRPDARPAAGSLTHPETPAVARRTHVDSRGRPQTITTSFAAACRALGFAVEADKNGDEAAGWGPLPMNVKGGIRWNTGLAYLVPLLGVRPNLEVRGGSEVRRVLFEGTRAVGVEYVDTHGSVGVARAERVVLAAGAIASPTILLRSGVGPAAQLHHHGIRLVADSPVGASFSDHPQIALRWIPAESPVGTAPSGTALESVLNAELDDGGDVELLPLMRPLDELLTGELSGDSALTMLVALQNPESRGELRLSEDGPEHPPLLDYRSLGTAADVERMRAAVRLVVAVLESAAFEAVSDGLADLDRATIDDDGRLDAWIQANLGTALHLCGTAPMGPDGDERSVVDPHGRVRGVTGLHVADLSIIPAVPRRGPAATAVLVGERVAAFLRAGS
ncbi:MAG: mycofactocin system GMC family oxidoreductase MftG [Herbiconiux sp.]|uniref:GMC family oxidoreductase N-terminal domain-containing protein n=1 Tax=Herbiconiux sp. TaxID=1871186 RepID=UPI00121A4C95|nr:GMC family oxidoreductase N-terminal domain-containing protein [Herbiconiux sp.]TAJ46814.1 MAG: mycofactocin system GMC family oxidoreductase MftG [Herbiconiux sp.]